MPRTLASAIAQMEGFNTPGTIAQRNNNPGNLRSGPGMIGKDAGGYAIFPDQATGWTALDGWIASHQSMTLAAAVDRYLGIQRDSNGNVIGNPDKNNPDTYLAGLVTMTGLQPGDTLSGAFDSTSGFVDPTANSSVDLSTLVSGIDLTSITVVVGVVLGALGFAWLMSDS